MSEEKRVKFLIDNMTDFVKQIISKKIEPGDFVIDGTMGNGNDTLFLANLVSEEGKVFSFDIQAQAISNTREKLEKANLLDRVHLILDGHEYIYKYVNSNIKLAMFNLGYLPGGDHRTTTMGETTILALEQVLELLLPGGIISICLYSGHTEGGNELELVDLFARKLSNKNYSVIKMDYINKKNNPPNLIIIEKIT